MPNYPHVVKPDMTLHEAQEALHDMFPRDKHTVSISVNYYSGMYDNSTIAVNIWLDAVGDNGICLHSIVCAKSYAHAVNLIREQIEATLPALHPDACEYCGATCDGEVCVNPWCSINCEAA